MARRQLIKKRPAKDEVDGGQYFSSPKENIEFIRSGCTMLDCALGGGWPLGRVANIVGDKSTGKTLLAIEAVANFLMQYPHGTIRYVEAEAAFDSDYAGALGVDFERVSFWTECETIEEVIKDVESIIKNKEGEKNPHPTLYIVDSLDALSDKAEKGREVDDGSFGAAKAKKLGEFFRRTVQGMSRAKVCLLIISQIRDNMNAGPFGKKHKRACERPLDFYSAQVCWLTHLKRLDRTVSKVKRIIGVQVQAKLEKNKVGLPFREAVFDIRFGYGIEDRPASLEFLKQIGVSGDSLSNEALRERVIKEWFRIEKTFLPQERKYGA